jgi:outer membrane protein assembly factor BamE (lipoprotein component of BamABCDE complex)
MKKRACQNSAQLFLCLAVAPFLFLGCATETTTTTGRDFDSSKAGQIVKGKTTADEIVAMFGTPSTKQPEAGDGEKWEYFYGTTTVKSSGMTPGGALLGVLIPGTVGNEVMVQNYNPKITVHDKTLTISLDKQRIVADFTLKK